MGDPTLDPDAPDNLRIATCQGLLFWVTGEAEQWTAERELDGADLILLSMFARSTRTYEAIVRWLGERVFSEQGLMLNRSLFEDMIDAHWVSLNRELATERMVQHDHHTRYLKATIQERFKAITGGAPVEVAITAGELATYENLFGKNGTNSWTGIRSLDQRMKKVLVCWRTEKDRTILEFWTAWVNKLFNEFLHPSSISIARLGGPEMTSEGRVEFNFGSTPEWLEQALHAAFFTYGQFVGLILQEFAPDVGGDLANRLTAGDRSFTRASEWDRRPSEP